MNWSFDPKTGGMKPKPSQNQILNKTIRQTTNKPDLKLVRTVRRDAKLLTDGQYQYLAVLLKGQWRVLGIITNMNDALAMLRGPIVNFQNAWLKGTPIDL